MKEAREVIAPFMYRFYKEARLRDADEVIQDLDQAGFVIVRKEELTGAYEAVYKEVFEICKLLNKESYQ